MKSSKHIRHSPGNLSTVQSASLWRSNSCFFGWIECTFYMSSRLQHNEGITGTMERYKSFYSPSWRTSFMCVLSLAFFDSNIWVLHLYKKQSSITSLHEKFNMHTVIFQFNTYLQIIYKIVLTSYFARPPIPKPSLWIGVMSNKSRSRQYISTSTIRR